MAAAHNQKRCEMYTLKPQYDPIHLNKDISSCMYTLKSLQGGEMLESATACNGLEQSPLTSIMARQEAILKRLSTLQTEVNRLAKDSHLSLKVDTPSEKCDTATQESQEKMWQFSGVIEDVVINANPASPPLSLFVLYQMLKNQYKMLTTAHIHSSVKEVPENLKTIFRNGRSEDRSQYQLALTLIWKDVKYGPTLMMSPATQTRLEGEATIARFMGRLMKPAYDAHDPALATQVDNWLDIASTQILRGNTKEKASALKSLNSALGKRDWLVGSSLTLADVFVWSSVQQTGLAEGAPGNVKKWVKSCSNLPAFQMANSILKSQATL